MISMSTKETKRQLRDFWDNSETYWNLLASDVSLTSPNRQKAATFVPAGATVLDLGCGIGANASFLKTKCRYVGVDLSLAALRRPVLPRLGLICGDADRLPFSDSAFDAVVATFFVEHLVNPVLTLREMNRIVRPGGRIVLLGPAWDFPFWFPPSLRKRLASTMARLGYAGRRFWRQVLTVLGLELPFLTIEPPSELEASYAWDMDAVYVVWTYEVVQLMRRLGCRLVLAEVENRLFGTNPLIRLMKRMLILLPIYRHAGSPTLLVFDR
jgi:SAM-dependent methyltransferase